MKKRTIFALTTAFVMGALAVTPLFAQEKNGPIPNNYMTIVDENANDIAPVLEEETGRNALVNKSMKVTKSMVKLLLPGAVVAELITNEKSRQIIDYVNLVVTPEFGMLSYNDTALNTYYAHIFVSAYNESEDKDAYVRDVFSGLQYKSEKATNDPLINAVINQDVEAFRSKYDGLGSGRKIMLMERIFTNFTVKSVKNSLK